MNCATCLETDLHNSIADCIKPNFINCAQQYPNEKAYCLTRQTQNGKGVYIVEKKCVTKREFYKNFPEEEQLITTSTDSANFRDATFADIYQLKSRCASTYDGYVNFCICDTDECNVKSLPLQAAEMSLKYINLYITKTLTEFFKIFTLSYLLYKQKI